MLEFISPIMSTTVVNGRYTQLRNTGQQPHTGNESKMCLSQLEEIKCRMLIVLITSGEKLSLSSLETDNSFAETENGPRLTTLSIAERVIFPEGDNLIIVVQRSALWFS